MFSCFWHGFSNEKETPQGHDKKKGSINTNTGEVTTEKKQSEEKSVYAGQKNVSTETFLQKTPVSAETYIFSAGGTGETRFFGKNTFLQNNYMFCGG